jgi:hypothetical protein
MKNTLYIINDNMIIKVDTNLINKPKYFKKIYIFCLKIKITTIKT